MTDRERRAARMSADEAQRHMLALRGCLGCVGWPALILFAIIMVATIAH